MVLDFDGDIDLELLWLVHVLTGVSTFRIIALKLAERLHQNGYNKTFTLECLYETPVHQNTYDRKRKPSVCLLTNLKPTGAPTTC